MQYKSLLMRKKFSSNAHNCILSDVQYLKTYHTVRI